MRFSAFKRIQRILSNYWLVGYGDGVNFRISFEDFYNQFELSASTGGGTPVFFEGLQMPSVNNEGQPLKKGDWTLLTAGQTYTNIGGGDPLNPPTGRWSISIFNGTSWVLKDMGALPIQTGVDTINPLGEGLTKEKAVARYVDPLASILNGGEVLFGDADFSTYTTNNQQDYLFLQKAFPNTVQGKLTEVNVSFHKSGAYNVYVARPVAGKTGVFTMLHKTPKTATVGDNKIVFDINILPGDLIGIGQITGGALVKTKTGVNQLYLNTSPINSNTYNGTEVTFSGSGRIMALNFKVQVTGLKGKVDSMDIEVKKSMKEDKLTYKPSINLFDPSKLVNDRYVNSGGGITSPNDPTPEEDADDWKMLYIDISDIPAGTKINWDAFNLTKPGYIAFYDKTEYVSGSSINLVAGTEEAPSLVNFTNSRGSTLIPPDSKGMAINAKRSTDTDSVFERAMLNIGAELLPYQPFTGKAIEKYNGIPFAGSQVNNQFATDQNTRKTDDVIFHKVTVEELESNVLIANIPEWDEVSANTLVTDQAYKKPDGSGNFIIKAKGGV